MDASLFLLLVLSGLGYVSARRGQVSTVERDLMNSLLKNYSKNVRPTTSSEKAVDVMFDLKLGKLVRLDIKNQVMVTNTRILMRWFDPSLQWNKTEKNNTNVLNIPSSLLWTPDILLYNTAVKESEGKTDVYKAHVLVKHTGIVTWMSTVILQASCVINIKWFPFDQQTCKLNFGSLSYTRSKIKLFFYRQPKSSKELQANFFFSSGHWTMTGMTSTIREEKFICCDDPFSVIGYTFNWKRLTRYWILFLILPCISLAVVSLFTFFIPPDTGERSGFAITTVLAMSVYLLVISDRMPEKSDDSPLIGVLYIVLFYLMTGVLVTVIITTYLSYKTTKPSERLKTYLRLSIDKQEKPTTMDACDEHRSFKDKAKNETDQLEMIPVELGTHSMEMTMDSKTKKGASVRRRRTLNKRISQLTAVEMMEMEDNQEEWRLIAARIDRIFFWIFSAFMVLAPAIVVISYHA